MLIDCSLSAIKEFLEKESFSCSLEKGGGEFPLDYLMIDMGKDKKKRDQAIQIFAVKKEIPQANPSSNVDQENSDKANFLNIQYFLPYKFQDKAVNDIARFLLLINKTLDFTGFGMSEVDRLIYFRLEQFCDRSKVNTDLLNGLLGYILLIVDSFNPTLEKLALQETNFQEVITQSLNHK